MRYADTLEEEDAEFMKRRLGTIKHNLTAGRLWYFSAKAYRDGNRPLAVAIKTLIYVLYKSLLCFECEIEDDLELIHGGLGTVCHPNVTIGKRVKMFHHITLAAETLPGSLPRIRIEDDCVIGAYAILIGNDREGITIGKGSVIGAGAMVVRDVPPGSTIVATPSRAVKPGKVYTSGDADA